MADDEPGGHRPLPQVAARRPAARRHALAVRDRRRAPGRTRRPHLRNPLRLVPTALMAKASPKWMPPLPAPPRRWCRRRRSDQHHPQWRTTRGRRWRAGCVRMPAFREQLSDQEIAHVLSVMCAVLGVIRVARWTPRQWGKLRGHTGPCEQQSDYFAYALRRAKPSDFQSASGRKNLRALWVL